MTAGPDTAAPAVEAARLRRQLAEIDRLWRDRLQVSPDPVHGDAHRHLRAQVRVGADLAAALDALARPRAGPSASG